MSTSSEKKKLLLLIFLALLSAAVILWLIFSQNSEQNAQLGSQNPSTSSETVSTNSALQAVADDEALIKIALEAKTGIPEDMLVVNLSLKDGDFAKGSVGTKGEETGGGYFLAVRDNGKWLIAYDGQANPNCEEVNPYNFPANMVPECLDSNGNLVTR
ncbi:MAG TPA: hypothetical protein VIH52_04310 [Candidatus Nanoarchaeia archaeon]